MNVERAENAPLGAPALDAATLALIRLRKARKAWKEALRVIGGGGTPHLRDFVRSQVNRYGEQIRAVAAQACDEQRGR